MDSLNALLTRLFTLHRKTIELSLGRIERLLAALASPEARLPAIVHVAGTNGKGSTIAFMRAILEAAGKRVHVYTSPHLVRFHERIRLGAEGGGKLVGDAELFAALTACEKVNEGQPITFFEVTTAAAFKLFSERPADYCC
jgi:dihydrofolate synthase/folylpolyglutamate synthase